MDWAVLAAGRMREAPATSPRLCGHGMQAAASSWVLQAGRNGGAAFLTRSKHGEAGREVFWDEQNI